MYLIRIVSICFFTFYTLSVFGQNDNAVYKEKKDGFYQNTIQKGIKEFENKDQNLNTKNYLSVDFKDKDYPVKLEDYEQFWHNAPLSQGATGTCWCFGSVSFFESEIFRTTGQKVKLSEMYFVYYEYIESTKTFVKKRGDMYFGEGSETNAVPKLMKLYGAVACNSIFRQIKRTGISQPQGNAQRNENLPKVGEREWFLE